MKQFFKFMFASMLGFFISCLVLLFIFFIIIAALVSSSDKEVVIPEKSVLLISLAEPLYERSTQNPFAGLPFEGSQYMKGLGLNDVIADIRKAEKDPKIIGILLDMSTVQSGLATVEAIRFALTEFKKSGKFIVSYADYYTQLSYYLASVSDKIFLNPQGLLDWKGLDARLLFFKGSLEKLNIDMQIVRHGKYKSAVEPLVNDRMSAENREQTTEFVQSFWKHMSSQVSLARKIEVAELNRLADELTCNGAAEALANRMVDSLVYRDGLHAWLRKKLAIGENDKINTVGLRKYIDVKPAEKKEFTKDKIAVVWASGDINTGEGSEESIGSDRISRAIRKARTDKNVKAIVLRVNSPGGMHIASEVIWREVQLAVKDKPVVASFGDYAASGGYYIACAANKIVAEPTTITGSIGVFGVIPNVQKMMNQKLGITIDEVMTNQNSDYIPVYKPLSDFQRAVLTKDIERIYDIFLTRVAEGRKMQRDEVDSIAQGRVWTGLTAKELGLVDETGGLDKALALAAELAEITNYRILSLPEQKDPFSELVEYLSGDQQEETAIRKALGPLYPTYRDLQNLQHMQGIQARLPFSFSLN
ncbi:MAG TPA: signal peptide peptidase SppA [Bacteroidales bacterium]|nr:signal peptide peptidase SppA [Bacteroidales bacterium]HSA44875.1 signal peptide peptidase SppA [Bacteroidales bacterium]